MYNSILVMRAVYMLTVALALLACFAFANYAEKARTALDVRDELATAYHGIVSLEKAQRAFIITRNYEYLADYHLALHELRGIRGLIALRAGQQESQSESLQQLAGLLDTRTEQIRSVMAVVINGSNEEIIEMINQNEDRDLNLAIFDTVQEMVSLEQARFNTYLDKQVLQLPVLALLVVFIGISGFIGTWFLRTSRTAPTSPSPFSAHNPGAPIRPAVPDPS